jgi:hypothetical protein
MRRRDLARACAAALVLAGASLAVVAPAPSYDPWTWLLWGRELAEGGLDTHEGPAFKPLPVAICALLAPLGDAAPWLWVLIVRAAALLAVWLAFRLGRELGHGSLVAGVLAAGAVAACGRLLTLAASGAETALLLALGLAAAEAWRARRPGAALACGVGCALLRVEAWPFLAVAAFAVWRRRPAARPALAALAVGVPAAWLIPELIGSGDPLRSGARAQLPNPGAPALEPVPALAALREAVALPLWPLWAGAAALAVEAWRARGSAAARALGPAVEAWRARGGEAARALGPAVAGGAWILLVAAMAQAGFSGEARYALPGAALVAISGAVGLARAPRVALPLVIGLLAVAAYPRVEDVRALPADQAYQWALSGDLAEAVDAAGGRDRVLACGRPYVGRLRGPLIAYRLRVARRSVSPDAAPRAPGVVFRSAFRRGDPPAPDAGAGFSQVARAGPWRVLAACRS